MTVPRRLVLSLVASLAAGLGVSAPAWAQSFPSKPLSVMVPYPAGGLSDTIARNLNVPLQASLGGAQPVVVENLGGASGSIAASKVLSAPTDGHTLYQGSPNELILAPLAMKSVTYKPGDWTPVHMISTAPMAIMVRPGLEANSADELVTLARRAAASGKPLTYASVGVGSFYHLLGEDLSRKINAPMTHVPYKGAADAVRDLGGNSVDIFITPYGAPHVGMAQQGRFKFIAALSPQRQKLLPNVATVDEGVALKGYHHDIWTGYFVPKATPAAQVSALNKALAATLGDPKIRAALEAQNQIVSPVQSLDDAAKFYAAGQQKFQSIAKAIKLEAQ